MRKKKKSKPVHLKNFVQPRETDILRANMCWLDWFPAPRKLGNFTQHIFGQYQGNDYSRLPTGPRAVTNKLSCLVPSYQFTTCFLRQCQEGQTINPHRDPKGSQGFVITLTFGDFRGGEVSLGKNRYPLKSGDILIRPVSTNRNTPIIRVAPVKSGTRYSLTMLSLCQK